MSGPGIAGSDGGDPRSGRFAELLTDALARSRPHAPHLKEPPVETQQPPARKEDRPNAETRAGTHDHEPDLNDPSASEADDPAADDEAPIAPRSALAPEEGTVAAVVLPAAPTVVAPPPVRAPSAQTPAGAPIPAEATAANPATETTAPASSLTSQDDQRLAGETGAAQPSAGAAVRSFRAPRVPMAQPSAAEPAGSPRPDASRTPEAANFARAVMAAAGTPVRLSVVSDQATGGVPASPQLAPTAQPHAPAHSSTETLNAAVPAAQAILLQRENASAPAPLPQTSRIDAVGPGVQSPLVTSVAAADLAAGGDGTEAFAFRDGSVSGRIGTMGRGGARSGTALKSTPDQVAVHVTRAARSGMNRIEIRLDPESLGRVEVTLEVGRDGRVSALVLAENREALDALKAEARALQQALQDAGLKPDADSLSFDMRGEHGRRSAGQAFVPEDQAARTPASRAAETEPKGTFQSAEPRRALNPRGQLDVLA